MFDTNVLIETFSKHLSNSNFLALCITIGIFLGFIMSLVKIMERQIVREVFSDEKGKLSSARFIGFIVVMIILGNWTYFNIFSNSFAPLSFDLLAAIIAAIYGPVAQGLINQRPGMRLPPMEEPPTTEERGGIRRPVFDNNTSRPSIQRPRRVRPLNTE